MRNLIQTSTINDVLGIRQDRLVVAGRNEVRVEACAQSFFSKHAGMAMRGLKQPWLRLSKPAAAAAGATRARLGARHLTAGTTPINLAKTSCQVGSPVCQHPEYRVRHSAARNS
jgi:hypothetical protein